MPSKPLIHEDFLLQTGTARKLYHEFAKQMPIVDYHCHLPSEQIAEDRRFDNLAQLWLHGDHYKWRAMRTAGVPERYCTGNASDWEKFGKWAETVPKCLRNPLYHWTHLELNRPFGINDRLLCPQTARGIWDECREKLASPEFSCRGILKQMNVVLICTTDDPCDDLDAHRTLRKEVFPIQVYPTFRPDKGMAVDSPQRFNQWVDELAAVADVDIRDFDTFLFAIRNRHDYFHEIGCRLSDHGLEQIYAEDYTEPEIQGIFNEVRMGNPVDREKVLRFKSAMLYEFALMDHEKGWTQQFHLGALRNTNSRMYDRLGPDTGFDSIGDFEMAKPLVALFDRLDKAEQLPKTILYNLNPKDNAVLATMTGNYQDGQTPGKMQFGSGWWFLDQKDGMEEQMEILSNMGLLSLFVGMLTDSRSFLSYTRHEYFRRILCNLLGSEMEQGLLPDDLGMVGAMVKDICYNNAARYFGFDLPVQE